MTEVSVLVKFRMPPDPNWLFEVISSWFCMVLRRGIPKTHFSSPKLKNETKDLKIRSTNTKGIHVFRWVSYGFWWCRILFIPFIGRLIPVSGPQRPQRVQRVQPLQRIQPLLAGPTFVNGSNPNQRVQPLSMGPTFATGPHISNISTVQMLQIFKY